MLNGIPTIWQNIIFRNYGIVSDEKIASVLQTDANVVRENAFLLGLQEVEFFDEWTKKGFVTVIRNNYDLLPDEEIAKLLSLSPTEFKKLLIDFDFLNVKLGKKPQIGEYRYAPLSAEQIERTRAIGEKVRRLFVKPSVKPFDFFADAPIADELSVGEYSVTDRFTSVYCGNYGDTLNDDDLSDYGDEYLRLVSATGVNGENIKIGLGSYVECTLPIFEGLKDSFPKAEIVKCNDIMVNLRKIKSENELACIKEGFRIIELATDEVIRKLRPGVTELEMVALHSASFMKTARNTKACLCTYSAKKARVMPSRVLAIAKSRKGSSCS